MFTKKTVKDLNIKGKRVLVRVDYNVPLTSGGKIEDDYRITQSLPTLQYLLDKGAAIILCSHLGRPEGKVVPSMSLGPVAKRLHELLKLPVEFANDCVGPETLEKAQALKPGQILLLENVRFHPEEEANDKKFAKELAALADVFVQDAFGVVHHGAVSVSGLPTLLPSAAGLLLAKEVDTITKVMREPERPMVAVVGGAKIADKIDILKKFIEMADMVAIGGAMANTFLKATGVDVAKSLVDDGELQIAKDVMARAQSEAKERDFVFFLPRDGVVAQKADKNAPTRIVDWGALAVADIEHYPKRVPASASKVAANEKILDIGPFSGAFIAGSLQLAGTVIWNGTMGMAEVAGTQGPVGPYAHGTELIMEGMLGDFGHKPFSVVGGGDTVAYVQSRGLTDSFNHVSTGGGASLELMAGRKLPGITALEDK